MARHYYRRPHRYKIKKPFFSKKFLALGFLALVVVGAIFYGLFLWRIFWVEKVIVTGEQKIAKEEIEMVAVGHTEKKILFFGTRSIFAVNTKQIREDILAVFPA